MLSFLSALWCTVDPQQQMHGVGIHPTTLAPSLSLQEAARTVGLTDGQTQVRPSRSLRDEWDGLALACSNFESAWQYLKIKKHDRYM